MGRSRYKFANEPVPHFLTCTVLNWLPVFTRKQTVQILADSLAFLNKDTGFRVYAYVFLENLIHLIADSPQLEKDMMRFKSFTAKKILVYLDEHAPPAFVHQFDVFKKSTKSDRERQFWQEGSHPIVVDMPNIFDQKLEYIHYNPVARGYVERPEHWCYSSARNYAGLDSDVDVFREWF